MTPTSTPQDIPRLSEPTAMPSDQPLRDEWLASFPSNYFAMVMATGIVSLAAQVNGISSVAIVLLVLNVIFYIALWALLLARTLRHLRRVVSDLSSHGRSVGFFTIVAATCVLGSQFLYVADRPAIAAGIWFAGIALWALFTYAIFTMLIINAVKPTLGEGIHGGWLLAVVAAQSVAALGAQVAEPMGMADPEVMFFCLTLWLGGGMLYIWIISLIFYRYMFFALKPADLSPPYWINMGAGAITTLAGTAIAAGADTSPIIARLLPFIEGFTLFFWATATWWIPMLLILGVWRHMYRHVPLRYDPQYWGLVFPLGMYTVCTYRLANTINAPFLLAIPRVFVFAAMIAWCIVFIGMVSQLIRLLKHPH